MEKKEMYGTCLKCGREAPLQKGLCIECFRESSEIFQIPDYIDITVCRSCGAHLKGKHWEYGGEINDIIEDEVLSSMEDVSGLEVSLEEMDIRRGGKGLYHVDIVTSAHFPGGGEITSRRVLTVRLKNSLCPRCSRLHGSYYEAVIQVRGGGKTPGRMEEAVDRVLERVDEISGSDPMTFVTKLVKVRGGWDVYVGRNQSAHRIARELHRLYGGDYTVSSKVVGRREGKELKRFTYLLRLPPWRRGDYLLKGGVPHRIEGFRGRKVRLRNIVTRREETVEISSSEKLPHFHASEVEMEATVLYTSEREIILMDPVNFREVNVRKPEGWKMRESVRVVRVEDDLYII